MIKPAKVSFIKHSLVPIIDEPILNDLLNEGRKSSVCVSHIMRHSLA